MKKYFDTDDWEILNNEGLNIKGSIVKYLHSNQGSLLKDIHYHVLSIVKTPIDIDIFKKYMKFWSRHYCSFFHKYGRIVHTTVDGKVYWFHFNKSHPYSRQQQQIIDKMITELF